MVDYIYKNRNDKNEVILSFSKLINILGLVNNTYKVGNYKKKELSEILNIELTAIYYFYNNTRSEFKNIIDRALKNLKKRSVLEVDNTYMIVTRDEHDKDIIHFKQADKDERSMIIDARNAVLQYLDLKDMQALFLAGYNTYKKFNELVKAELPKEWIFYFQAYDLIIGKNAIRREYNIIQQRKRLNQKSIDRMTTKLKITSAKDNESQLITKLISLINYDVNLDNQINDLYVKHENDYYNALVQKGNQLNEVIQLEDKIKLDIMTVKNNFENYDAIDAYEYYAYANGVKYRKQMDDMKEYEALFG